MTEGIEIERKHLVERLADRLDVFPSREIEQGYMASPTTSRPESGRTESRRF